MADTADSKSAGRKAVSVRVRPPAPINPFAEAKGFFLSISGIFSHLPR